MEYSVSSGSLTVNGSNISKAIKFTSNLPPRKTGISNIEFYAIICAIAAVVAIAAAFVFIKKRRLNLYIFNFKHVKIIII